MSRATVLLALSVGLVLIPTARLDARVKKSAGQDKTSAASGSPSGGTLGAAAESPEPDPFAETPQTDAQRRAAQQVLLGPHAPSKSADADAQKRPRAAKAKAGPLRVGEQAILKAMEEPVTLDVVMIPLDDFAEYLGEDLRVATAIDWKARGDAHIGTCTPITCHLSEIPLHSALELALQPAGLTWTIKSDVLLITTPEIAESTLVTKTYDVSDLLVPMHDRPYRGRLLPSVMQDPTSTFGGLGAGAPGDHTGSVAGILGNDYHVLPRTPPEDIKDALESLVNLVTSVVAPSSWDTAGGPGSIQQFGRSMTISQTVQIHGQVQTLFADLRAMREAVLTLVVDLQWVWLDRTQYEFLLGSNTPPAHGRIALALNPRTLDKLGSTVPGFRGRIACASGQLVHLASGDRRSAITSAIPVIGSGVGYQPVIEVPNAGVVLEIRPTAATGGATAVLDVQSTVTRWGKSRPQVHVGASWPPSQTKEDANALETTQEPGGAASCPVDRPVMPAQQLATTVRVPLGKPVLVGAMSFAPAADAGLANAADSPQQLCLIATTSIAAEKSPAAPERKKRRR